MGRVWPWIASRSMYRKGAERGRSQVRGGAALRSGGRALSWRNLWSDALNLLTFESWRRSGPRLFAHRR